MNKVVSASNARSVSLDLKSQSLLVQGDIKAAKRAAAFISRLTASEDNKLHNSVTESINQCCPVCFCCPEDDETGTVVDLSCNHHYCASCFNDWMNGMQTVEFPISCLADGCKHHIELDKLNQILPSETFITILRKSLDNHVNSNKHLQFCISPGCLGIYKIEKKNCVLLHMQ